MNVIRLISLLDVLGYDPKPVESEGAAPCVGIALDSPAEAFSVATSLSMELDESLLKYMSAHAKYQDKTLYWPTMSWPIDLLPASQETVYFGDEAADDEIDPRC